MIQDSDFFTNRPDEPIDPHNPFRNPTENHAYAPDYTRIVPQIETLGCQIPLQPAPHEKKKKHLQ